MVWKGGPGSPGLAAPGSGGAGGVAVRGRGLPDTSSAFLGGAGVEQLELAPLPGRVPGLWPASFLCSSSGRGRSEEINQYLIRASIA